MHKFSPCEIAFKLIDQSVILTENRPTWNCLHLSYASFILFSSFRITISRLSKFLKSRAIYWLLFNSIWFVYSTLVEKYFCVLRSKHVNLGSKPNVLKFFYSWKTFWVCVWKGNLWLPSIVAVSGVVVTCRSIVYNRFSCEKTIKIP